MQDILDQLRTWDEPFALATVVDTWHSAPRQPGAAMAVDRGGRVIGSVSGGCVESDLYLRAQEVLRTGEPEIVHYGVSDDQALGVGLTCGGELEVLINRVDPADGIISSLADKVWRREPVALATIAQGPGQGTQLVLPREECHADSGDPRLDRAIDEAARGLLEQGRSQQVKLGRHGERRKEEVSIFIETYLPPPRMIIFGAIDFAASLARLGSHLGFRVTVCDARPVFATAARFPEADEVVTAWPHLYLPTQELDRRTAICILTHDPKFDVPVIIEALGTEAGYIGVMGSRRTDRARRADLIELGVTDDDLARLSSPIGLDLGARTPEETAVSIGAEIIARRWGGTGRSLSDLESPIHGTGAPETGSSEAGSPETGSEESGSPATASRTAEPQAAGPRAAGSPLLPGR